MDYNLGEIVSTLKLKLSLADGDEQTIIVIKGHCTTFEEKNTSRTNNSTSNIIFPRDKPKDNPFWEKSNQGHFVLQRSKSNSLGSK